MYREGFPIGWKEREGLLFHGMQKGWSSSETWVMGDASLAFSWLSGWGLQSVYFRESRVNCGWFCLGSHPSAKALVHSSWLQPVLEYFWGDIFDFSFKPRPAVVPMKEAKWPPAEDPHTAIRLGSISNFSAFPRSQRIAALQSWICAGHLIGCSTCTKYLLLHNDQWMWCHANDRFANRLLLISERHPPPWIQITTGRGFLRFRILGRYRWGVFLIFAVS